MVRWFQQRTLKMLRKSHLLFHLPRWCLLLSLALGVAWPSSASDRSCSYLPIQIDTGMTKRSISRIVVCNLTPAPWVITLDTAIVVPISSVSKKTRHWRGAEKSHVEMPAKSRHTESQTIPPRRPLRFLASCSSNDAAAASAALNLEELLLSTLLSS